jgi:hypothetical protein
MTPPDLTPDPNPGPASQPADAAARKPATRGGYPEDLSDAIRLAVPRLGGDVVRCTRIGPRHYRCNWWQSVSTAEYDNPAMKGGQIGTTYRVRRSAFLAADRGNDGALRFHEIAPAGGPTGDADSA